MDFTNMQQYFYISKVSPPSIEHSDFKSCSNYYVEYSNLSAHSCAFDILSAMMQKVTAAVVFVVRYGGGFSIPLDALCGSEVERKNAIKSFFAIMMIILE